MPDLSTDLLTPDELCVKLKISRRTYTRLMQQGMPHRLVLTARRYVFADVLAWLPRRAVLGRVGLVRPSGSSNGGLLAHLKQLAKVERGLA